VTLALDTGATGTVINTTRLVQIGYDPTSVGQPIQLTTAGGVVQAFRLPVSTLSTLGQTRSSFRVVAHSVPAHSSVEGVLGLDFIRGHILTVDFLKGEISLVPGISTGTMP
jgi:predicted aspartyl protease